MKYKKYVLHSILVVQKYTKLFFSVAFIFLNARKSYLEFVKLDTAPF